VLDQAPLGAEIERQVIHGRSPAAALSLLAEEQDAAAIVLGSAYHRRQGFAVTGGVARQLFATVRARSRPRRADTGSVLRSASRVSSPPTSRPTRGSMRYVSLVRWHTPGGQC
jgi:nucleotide-binding universal stress UspA family protein